MIFNKKQMAEIFNVTIRTISDWEAKGMPVLNRAGRGKSNDYESSACIDWRIRYMAYGGKYTSAKERKEEAEASLLELKLEKESGDILNIDEVEQAVSIMLTILKKRLEGIPIDLHEVILKSYLIDVDMKILKDFIRNILTELHENTPQFEIVEDDLELENLS